MWSLVSSEALIMIQSKLPMVPIRESDRTICITSKTGDFSCAKGWVQIPFKAPVVNWWKMVWISKIIPRHVFSC